MNILKFIWSYIVRSIGLLLYFASFPFILYGLFSIPYGTLFLITGVGLMILGIMLEMKAYGDSKKTFKKLAIITLVPLIIFVIFNLALTAGFANFLKTQLEGTIGETPSELQYFFGIAIENYQRIIPGLWITALAYAIMVIILFRASSSNIQK